MRNENAPFQTPQANPSFLFILPMRNGNEQYIGEIEEYGTLFILPIRNGNDILIYISP